MEKRRRHVYFASGERRSNSFFFLLKNKVKFRGNRIRFKIVGIVLELEGRKGGGSAAAAAFRYFSKRRSSGKVKVERGCECECERVNDDETVCTTLYPYPLHYPYPCCSSSLMFSCDNLMNISLTRCQQSVILFRR